MGFSLARHLQYFFGRGGKPSGFRFVYSSGGGQPLGSRLVHTSIGGQAFHFSSIYTCPLPCPKPPAGGGTHLARPARGGHLQLALLTGSPHTRQVALWVLISHPFATANRIHGGPTWHGQLRGATWNMPPRRVSTGSSHPPGL